MTMMVVRGIGLLVALVQAVLGIRVLLRMARTAKGVKVPRSTAPHHGTISVLVPVLNEAQRLVSCLEGLSAQGPAVREILVADGGSTDGTQQLINRAAARDSRIRLIDASPIPANWNGKAWGLSVAEAAASADTEWVLCIDADVYPTPELAPALLAFVRERDLPALSIATRQALADDLDGLIHPSMLTTLVYRFGIPGQVYANPTAVQANGQCMLIRRTTLREVGGFAAVADTVCEDVALARTIVKSGQRVGFFESDAIATTRMYSSGCETWREWPRSLPMRDHAAGFDWISGLAEVTLVQAGPLLVVIARLCGRLRLAPNWVVLVNTILLVARLGVLAGTRRAYRETPATYWLSPLMDIPVAIKLVVSSFRTSYLWRGRVVQRGGGR